LSNGGLCCSLSYGYITMLFPVVSHFILYPLPKNPTLLAYIVNQMGRQYQSSFDMLLIIIKCFTTLSFSHFIAILQLWMYQYYSFSGNISLHCEITKPKTTQLARKLYHKKWLNLIGMQEKTIQFWPLPHVSCHLCGAWQPSSFNIFT
jgi:hypothetical protein